MVAAYALYDRFDQHPKQNIPRFEERVPGVSDADSSRTIKNMDTSALALERFVRNSIGKRIYMNIDFLGDSLNSNLSLDILVVEHPGLPSKDGAFRFSFLVGCDKNKKIQRKLPGKSGCSSTTIHIEPRGDVEQQVFPITPLLYQVRGYFLDVGMQTTQGGDTTYILQPISASQLLS